MPFEIVAIGQLKQVAAGDSIPISITIYNPVMIEVVPHHFTFNFCGESVKFLPPTLHFNSTNTWQTSLPYPRGGISSDFVEIDCSPYLCSVKGFYLNIGMLYPSRSIQILILWCSQST